MRVYEYAKKYKLSSKELLVELETAGFDFASHMSVLTPEALSFLDKKFSKNSEGPKGLLKKASTERIAREPGEDRDAPFRRGQKEAIEKPKAVERPKGLVLRAMSLADVAEEIGRPATDVILTLLKKGVVASKNQILQKDMVKFLADHYGVDIILSQVEIQREKLEKKMIGGPDLQARFPVVVVMGHVDHGKTTLLDFIRKTRVAAKEKGGITQHLGAYEVNTPQGGIVFLDTPGHEAFSRIRMRGARVADIAILVIAADDSIMPQTVEAIKHAKNMEIPIIVAINKIDKASSSQIEKVKQDLARHDLLPEDWGGDVVCVPISAKLGQGVDHLIDMIVLQAEMMELRASKTLSARGYVLESKIERGRGSVATVILQHGVAKVGDFFVCGKTFGKINSMVDSSFGRILSAGPSIPFQIAGFSDLPEAGDLFRVVSRSEYRKAKLGKLEDRSSKLKVSSVGVRGDINIIIKADSDSSKEALFWSIERLSKKFKKGFNIVHSAVGDISESDVDLAAISGSKIFGLHVKVESKAALLAQGCSVEIILFNIIYKLIEHLQVLAESKKEVQKELKKIGEASVLKVFKIKNVGVIAGCIVRDGRIAKGSLGYVFRDNKKIGEGKILSLQRDNKSVKEAHTGFECAFLVNGFDEWVVGDRVDCYLEVVSDDKR